MARVCDRCEEKREAGFSLEANVHPNQLITNGEAMDLCIAREMDLCKECLTEVMDVAKDPRVVGHTVVGD